MKSPSTIQRVLTVIGATLLLLLSAAMAGAAVYDFTERGRVPRGVTVLSEPLGGMTEDDARQALEAAVKAPLLRPVTVAVDDQVFTFDPSTAVSVDIDAMLEQAYAPRRSAGFVTRLQHDVAGKPLPAEVSPIFSLDEGEVSEWLATVAKASNKRAVDATITVRDGEMVMRNSKPGRSLPIAQAAQTLTAAFNSDEALDSRIRTIELPITEIKPKVTEDSFGKTIVVDLSQRKVRLYDGSRLEKMYPCAIGTPQFPTPQGKFEIVLKRYRPTWVNPGSGWAKDMPQSIPPGPSNPLGTRALNLSASGIRFHGTNKISSVGTAASHGCMRMVRHDIEDLYERVEVGTPVYIVP